MNISEASYQDFVAFWPVFESIVSAQETYAFDPQIDLEAAYQLWCLTPDRSFVIKEGDDILGAYYIKANGAGPSAHICNCGYMVAANARGKGIARQLCEHSQVTAKELGYSAMQFNSVVSTNTIAIALWKKLGYQIIGTIPNAYRHRTAGFVDCHVMYKSLI